MKKILFVLTLCFLTKFVNAQDSVQVTINWQIGDIKFAGTIIPGDPGFENLFDTTKPKMRVQNLPANNSTYSITAYTIDWLNIYNRLNGNIDAVKGNIAKRLHDLLLAVNQPYLKGKINAADAADNDAVQMARQYGTFRWRRSNN